MTKRKGNGKRGGRGGGQDDNGRGRGWRGRGGGRGRGIPGSHPMDEALDFNIQIYADAHLETPPYGGDRGGHTRQVSQPNSEHNTPNRTPNRGRGRGFRGRGRGHPEMHSRSRYSDFGIGASPNERGRGGGTQKLRLDAPLTRLLYQDRPLLRPIVFVPSVLNPTLFDQDDSLLKPGVEEVGDTEQSHVPTAARVSRVFSGGNIRVMESSSEADNDDSNDDEELKVVDFNDVGKLFEQTKKRKKISPNKSSVEVVEKPFIGGFIDNQSIPPSTSSLHRPQRDLIDIDTLTKRIDENLSATERSQEDDVVPADALEPSQFYIDIQPTPIPAEIAPPSNLFPSDEFDDDIIVYVAPHPRKGVQTSPERQLSTNGVPDTSTFTPYVRDASLALAVASSSSTTAAIEQQPQPQSQNQIRSISDFPFSFPTPEGKILGRLSVPPVTISRLAISWKRKKGVLSKKGGKRTRSSFRAYGAMREEAQLHDPKQNERRRGDSDLDWGDTDGDNDDEIGGEQSQVVDAVDGVESLSGLVNGSGNGSVNGMGKGKGKAREVEDGHGMEIDSDLDLNTMQQFVGGLLGEDAGRHVTMDDLMDEEQMRLDNEPDTGEDSVSVNESVSDGSSGDEDAEIDRVLADEEAMLFSETLEFEDEDKDDGSEDEDENEDENQTPRTSFQQRLERLRKQASSSKHYDEYVSDDYDDFDDMLERHMLFVEKDNKARSYYDAEADGDLEYFNHRRSKKHRATDLPEHLVIQWENDRLKKAAFKKARAQARLEAAADPLSRKKGGKKGRKAMLAAASVDPTITVLPNRVIDMVTLVQQIKRFIDDEGRQSMALPPTDSHIRKNIHDLALAFNMKSISKGVGDARYTTLTKTSRSGFDVDEDKVAKIVRRKNGPREFVKKSKTRGDSFVQDKKKDKKARTGARVLVPRHREGEEVGKAAPKLSSSNLGFRMLAMMGWSEGERIGVSGGIQDPLTAIIKNTKLGLGAAK